MKPLARIRVALSRALARADTWVAGVALVLTGSELAKSQWVLAILTGVVGVVFLVASGDYCWRRGFVAGRRAGGSGTSAR
ncbi:MAG TPA: hypothetical protein VGH94_04560 [Acidimicrobiales bacterium]|jgi:hypothetical protein